jgi:hypothetical protein
MMRKVSRHIDVELRVALTALHAVDRPVIALWTVCRLGQQHKH